MDPCTLSNIERVICEHMAIDWFVDFERHAIKGHVLLRLRWLDENCNCLELDTRDLSIVNVRTKNESESLKFTVEPCDVLAFGSKLRVHFPPKAEGVCGNKSDEIIIEYETSPNSTALQWLEARQTVDQKHPYVFSQCQAIHARSLLPCQDTPSVKCTYTSKVTVPASLKALMSAVPVGEPVPNRGPGGSTETLTYSFEQKIPIPSYLIAIAIGDIASERIGPRSFVHAEPSVVKAAAWEFAEVESILQIAEKLLGPYVWGTYDVLVLPASFPFGGMENPCLTFATPTLLAGDRSLVDVLVHEIAHSWSGNLFSNASFEHFWLNEGHTTYLQNLIDQRALAETINDLFGPTHEYTKLVIKMDAVDPDDSFSKVPYVKGCTLLDVVTERVGGAEVFLKFLRSFIDKFAYKSVNTEQWKKELIGFFGEGPFQDINWEEWFHAPGMPPIVPNYDTSLVTACQALAQKWINAETLEEFSPKDIQGWRSAQIEEFLSILFESPSEALTHAKLANLGDLYGFTTTKNSELRFIWIRLGIKARWVPIIQSALDMVTSQGRMKFTRPIYRDLIGWEETKEKALATFSANREFMHNTTAKLVAKDLGLTTVC